MSKKYRIPVWAIVIIVLIAVASGVAMAAVFTPFSDSIGVSYGEVVHEQSDLEVVDYEINGPGMNVDSVEVTVRNTGSDEITAGIDVWLMHGDSVVREGSTSDTWTDGEEKTVTVSIDRVRENQFSQIDIRVEEQ